ncbi:MAG: zinc metallopeptidase [Spirochaetia bacterium]
MLGFIDPLYWIMLIPALIIAGIATLKTRSTFAKYQKIRARSGLTGAQAARKVLDDAGLRNVRIQRAGGYLSDHYDPRSNTLRLSRPVYGSSSLAALGVACHEAGHALQHADNYAPLGLRSILVPAAQFGSNGAYIVFLLGLLFGAPLLLKIGIVLFTGVVAFSIITLPVEWNATKRAKKAMVSAGIVTNREQKEAGKVLNAAFLTYVASAFTAIMTLLYFIIRAGGE